MTTQTTASPSTKKAEDPSISAILDPCIGVLLEELMEKALDQDENEGTIRFLIRQGAPIKASYLEQCLEGVCRYQPSDLLPNKTIAQDMAAGKLRALLHYGRRTGVFPPGTIQKLLLRAIEMDRPSVIGTIIVDGHEDPNFMTKDGVRPLHLVQDRYLVAGELIAYGANPNLFDHSHGLTALHVACRDGYLSTAKQLKGADPNIPDKKQSWMPLHYAIAYGHGNVVEWLIQKKGANPNPCSTVSPFALILPSKTPRGIDRRLMPSFLINNGIDAFQRDVVGSGDTALHTLIKCAATTQEEYNEIFLEQADDLLSTVPSLIHARNWRDFTALHLVQDATWMIDLLVEKYDADLTALDRDGRTPLTRAIMHGTRYPTVHCLLARMKERRLHVNGSDKYGWTALHWAVFLGREAHIRLLLEYGADCDMVNSYGRLPLHLATYPFSEADDGKSVENFGDWDISRILDSGTFPALNRRGGTRSLIANGGTKQEWIQLLVRQTNNRNGLDFDQNLPFFLAACTSNVCATFVMLRASVMGGLLEPVPSRASPVTEGFIKTKRSQQIEVPTVSSSFSDSSPIRIGWFSSRRGKRTRQV